MVERLIWDQEAVGSNPTTQTKKDITGNKGVIMAAHIAWTVCFLVWLAAYIGYHKVKDLGDDSVTGFLLSVQLIALLGQTIFLGINLNWW